MSTTVGYAALDATSPLEPVVFDRREPGPKDVSIQIQWCGVCHSDVHQARDEWGNTEFPSLPGHEVVGRVEAVGDHVTRHAVGDTVGIGCMTNSCQHCEQCRAGNEQYCLNGTEMTYNVRDEKTGLVTLGGYSGRIVAPEQFVLRIPEGLEPAAAAPLLCAGVTTWHPLRRHRIGAGHRIGVVGVGGLGHVAIQIATALGAEVVAFTRDASKEQDARDLGAVDVVVTTDDEAMDAHAKSLDLVLSTIPLSHDINPFTALLKVGGTYHVVGSLEPSKPIDTGAMAFGEQTLATSLIGNLDETQDVLDFCAEHGITARVEVIAPSEVNAAFDKLVAGSVRYRYVLDMSLLDADALESSARPV